MTSTARAYQRRGAGTQPSARGPALRVVREGFDRHRPLTVLALAGLGVGALLALFGLPPVDLPSSLNLVGVVCPLCGGTRAVYYAMLGQWDVSWAYNPLGVMLVTGAAVVIVRHVAGAVSGRWLNLRVRWHRATVVGVSALLAAGILALWVNQQLHAELLVTG